MAQRHSNLWGLEGSHGCATNIVGMMEPRIRGSQAGASDILRGQSETIQEFKLKNDLV